MMIVPTYVGPSQIEGVGIFAAAPIKSGDAIWALEEKFDLLFPVNELAGLPDLQRQFLERYGYPHMTRPDMFVLEFDNGRFMNHCEQPNTDFRSPETGWAIRDIAAGEELTCNYAEFDPTFEMLPGRTFLNASVVQEMRGMAAAE
ncbi:SET domain-containing protein [Pacificimonas sp. ICDLI1SI03]